MPKKRTIHLIYTNKKIGQFLFVNNYNKMYILNMYENIHTTKLVIPM